MENFEIKQRKIPEDLSPEEERVWNEIVDLEDSFVDNINKKKISRKSLEEVNEKIINFGEELKAQGINPYKYLLWHKLIGSSGIKKKDVEFDIDDHRIEKFIRELYSEYTK